MIRVVVIALVACAARPGYEAAMYAGQWDRAVRELAVPRDDPRAEILALVATSRVLLDEGLNRRADVARALAPAERAHRLAAQLADRTLLADALDRVGMVRYWQWALADETSGDALLLAAEAAFTRARTLRGGAYSHFHLGLVAEGKGDIAGGAEHFSKALALAGSNRAVASYAVRHVAAYDEKAGRREIAEQRFRRSLALRRALGWRAGTASALDALAGFLVRSERAAEARPLLREAITLARGVGSHYYAAQAARSLAALEAAAGNRAAALAVLDEANSDVAVLSEPLRRAHADLRQRLTQ